MLGSVAQRLERGTHNPLVVGSNPTGPKFEQFGRAVASVALFGVMTAVLLVGACMHWRAVFPAPGRIVFVDADCYARMSRVDLVLARSGRVVRAHAFENYPLGTRPHTTAPLDYLIATLAGCFSLAGWNADTARDFAGAWISPLLGVATLAFLWRWVRSEKWRYGWAILGLAATSPILAHGFALGRPDHQSLLVFCLTLGLAAEISQWKEPSRAWGRVSGAAWALALWTSLYEPLVLLFAVVTTGLLFGRAVLLRRERLPGLALGGGLLLLALAVEGVRLETPTAESRTLLLAWTQQIGELRSQLPWSPTLVSWTGWSLLLAPATLALAWRRMQDRRALALACWLTLIWVLTCWQARWGYFLALVAALTLPWQLLGALGQRVRALGYTCWLLASLPTLGAFERRLDTFLHNNATDRQRASEALALREAADFLRREAPEESSPRGVLAPWWDAPALAYWSGQPGVAGSSHECLPGIADTARFFLLPASDENAARELLHARRVRWVVAADPARVLPTSAELLGRPAPGSSEPVLGNVLANDPLHAPPLLRLVFANPDLKVYAVEPSVFALAPPP